MPGAPARPAKHNLFAHWGDGFQTRGTGDGVDKEGNDISQFISIYNNFTQFYVNLYDF